MTFSTTNKAAYQQYKSSSLLPLGRKKSTMKQHESPLVVMSAAHTDNIKNTAKKTLPPSFVSCDILNHSQGNFVIEIKPIS